MSPQRPCACNKYGLNERSSGPKAVCQRPRVLLLLSRGRVELHQVLAGQNCRSRNNRRRQRCSRLSCHPPSGARLGADLCVREASQALASLGGGDHFTWRHEVRLHAAIHGEPSRGCRVQVLAGARRNCAAGRRVVCTGSTYGEPVFGRAGGNDGVEAVVVVSHAATTVRAKVARGKDDQEVLVLPHEIVDLPSVKAIPVALPHIHIIFAPV
mmetsp:Transcript_10266/g.31391  ORF Transcript_10266/g.31391 Transcript_10266/m.31391 type:complete len:212 (+) Transcript_10266:1476-2111(+)